MGRTVLRRARCALLAALLPFAAHAAPGDPLGPAFRLDTPGLLEEVGQHDVARRGSGAFVAAWDGYAGFQSPDNGVHLRRFDVLGAPLEAERHVDGSGSANVSYTAVATNDSGAYAVAWTESKAGYPDLFVRAYDASGQPRGPAVQVNPIEKDLQISHSKPALAMAANGDFVVVWLRTDFEVIEESLVFLFSFDYYYTTSTGIVAQRFSANGAPLGKAQRVATGVRTEFPLLLDPGNGPGAGLGRSLDNPSVTMHDDGRYLVAWTSKSYDHQYIKNQNTELRMQRYSAAGKEQGQSILVHKSGLIDATAVDMDAAGNSVVAWSDSQLLATRERDLMLRRYDAAGKPLAAAMLGHVDTSKIQKSVDLAVAPGGSFVLAWENTTEGLNGQILSRDLRARRFGANGNPLAPEFVVASAGWGIRVTVDALGNPLFVWGVGLAKWGRAYQGP